MRPLLLLLILWFTTGCAGMLYYPNDILYVDPEKLNVPPQDVKFDLKNGLTINGWYFASPVKPAKGVVLFFHGNGGNRTAHFARMYWLVEQGFDLAIFDYPGYGATGGKPRPSNTIAMAEGAIQFVHQRNPQLPLVVYGQSLGGAVAMRAVWELRKEVQPRLLIVDSTFLSYRQIAREVLARSWVSWPLQPLTWVLLSDRWAPGTKIRDIGVPLLVIHSRQDEIVPFKMGERVFETAGEPKEFLVIENGFHNGPFSPAHRPFLVDRLTKAVNQKK